MMLLMPAPLQIQRVPEDKATRMRLRQSRLVVVPAEPQAEDRPAHARTQKHSQSSAYRMTEGTRSRLISPSWHLRAPIQKWRHPLTVLFSHNT